MSEQVREIGAAEFESLVVDASGPVVLDFFSTECPPCEALAPKFESVAEAYAGRAQFYKIYRQGHREVAARLGVTGSPTVLFLLPGLQEVGERLSGEIKKTELKAAVEKLLSPGA